MGQVSVREARDNLSRLIKDAQAGEDVVIASHGRPVVRLVPIGRHRGSDILEWLASNPMPPASQRAPEAIDADLAAERDSWE
jgi:prevent-host-death family protein